MQENRKIAIFGKTGSSITIALLKHVFCKIKSKIPYDVCINNFEKNNIIVKKFDDKNIHLLETTDFNRIICFDLEYSKKDIEKIKSIVAHQTKDDYLILNIDDKNVKSLYISVKNDINHKSKVVPISIKKLQKDGASFIGNEIYFDGKEYLTDELKIFTGEQNKTNILAAFTLLLLDGFDAQEAIDNIYTIKSINNIFETILHKNNFTFINDIKNNNNLQSLKTFDNIYWILCANDIKFEFHKFVELGEYFRNIKYIFILGEYNDEMLEIFRKNKIKYFITYNMNDVFRQINELMEEEKQEEKIHVVLSSLNDMENNEFYKKCSQEFGKIVGSKDE